jgi:prepilin-type N-terminal cleavage/methylation domain-containing protein
MELSLASIEHSNTRIKSKARHSGLTLVELMIVVAIISLLVAIASPIYSRFILRAKLTETATQFGALHSTLMFRKKSTANILMTFLWVHYRLVPLD